MTAIRFTAIGQPTSMKNRRQIVSIGGKPQLIKSKEAREYERDFLRQIPAAAKQRLDGPVRVTMHLYYGWEGPDLDGSLILDLMADRWDRLEGPLVKTAPGEYKRGPKARMLTSKGVYQNDRQAREIHLFHHIDKQNPRAEIEVEPLEARQPDLLADVPVLQTAGSPPPF